jgi:hypothetical protein
MKKWLQRIDVAIRQKLCAKFGHKFCVGTSGYYVGMPQSHCWRCGAPHPPSWNKCGEFIEPMGGWFD